MICLPLSKSSWLEGRIGPEKYQDCYRLVKKSIDLLNTKRVDKILLLSEFKSKQSNKSELEYLIDVCKKHNVNNDNLYIEKYGYDTFSQLKFAFDLCKKEKEDLLILSSLSHYPRVVWTSHRMNRKYNIKIKNKIVFGIPRLQDVVFDIVLLFIYPIIDICGYADKFTEYTKTRRDKGYI